MTCAAGSHAEWIGETEEVLDRLLRNVAHGRFERSLSGLTAVAAVVTTAEILRTYTLDGVGADWPIGYQDIRRHYERLEAELPVAGQNWPWGYPHRYPSSPHPISGAAAQLWKGARKLGIEMRVGPVGIVNGTFGNRPHCIYRGYCLQGCKVNAKASPYVTHLPDALAHGVEIRANCMAARIELDETGAARGVVYYEENGVAEQLQRAKVVAVAGCSIETPRLLLNSASSRFPHGLGNDHDQVGRYVMVQGATQSAGRWSEELRMYKAPPPEVSSEQFYETDAARGFARGFSVQTVSPLPIGWSEHVLADGHWGRGLREYMRDCFAETEQVAFHTANLVPGIDFTNDPLLQFRNFSYLDTQLIRLGGPNFAQLPVNRPVADVRTNQHDGYGQIAIPRGKSSYHKNSLGGGCPAVAGSGAGADVFRHYTQKVDGQKIRQRAESCQDHYSQSRRPTSTSRPSAPSEPASNCCRKRE